MVVDKLKQANPNRPLFFYLDFVLWKIFLYLSAAAEKLVFLTVSVWILKITWLVTYWKWLVMGM